MSNMRPVPYQGKEPYIFVSYAHRDMNAVYSMISEMTGKGLRVWFDEGIDPGTEWDDNIASHVIGCDSMVAFISANYLASDNCKDELNYARDLNKDRLLIYLEEVELPAGMAMRLNRLQAINQYRYDNPEDFWNKLLQCKFLVRSMSENKPDRNADRKHGDEESDAETLYELALRYQSGRGVQKDYNEAVRLFRLAADRNHPMAMYNLGRCYAVGRGVTQDYREAEKWHLKAAEQGCANSQRWLGNTYLNGRPEIQKNPAEAAKWYREAAMQEDEIAQMGLGICCENGWGIPLDYSEAMKWYLKSSEHGWSDARYYIGKLYLDGNGVEKDYTKAVKWFENAGSNPDALCILGYCYEKGYGVEQNPAEAVRLYREAEEKGHLVTAQVNLANCYMNGTGVEKDCSEACKWYRKAAENTDAFDYSTNFGDCDQKAARQGQALAQFKLAECYLNGIGVEKDEKEAFRLYMQAAEGGNKDAKDKLAGESLEMTEENIDLLASFLYVYRKDDAALDDYGILSDEEKYRHRCDAVLMFCLAETVKAKIYPMSRHKGSAVSERQLTEIDVLEDTEVLHARVMTERGYRSGQYDYNAKTCPMSPHGYRAEAELPLFRSGIEALKAQNYWFYE